MRGIPGREGLEQTAQPQFKVGDRVEFVFNGEKKTGTVTGLEVDNPFVTISGDDGGFYAISSSVKLLPEEQMVDVTRLVSELVSKASGNMTLVYTCELKLPRSTVEAIIAPYMEGSDE